MQVGGSGIICHKDLLKLQKLWQILGQGGDIAVVEVDAWRIGAGPCGGGIFRVFRVEKLRRDLQNSYQRQHRGSRRCQLLDDADGLMLIVPDAESSRDREAYAVAKQGDQVVHIAQRDHGGGNCDQQQRSKGRDHQHQRIEPDPTAAQLCQQTFRHGQTGQYGDHACPYGDPGIEVDGIHIGVDPAEVVSKIHQLLEHAAAGNQFLRKEMVKARRVDQAEHRHAAQRTAGEPGQILPAPFCQQIHIAGGAEEEGVEHIVILGQQAQHNGNTGQYKMPPPRLLKDAQDPPCQHHRQKGQQHVHPHHDGGGNGDAAQTVKCRAQQRDAAIPEGAQRHPIEHHADGQQKQNVGDHADPFGIAAGEEGGDPVDQQIVQWGVNILRLIIPYGAEAKSIPVGHGQIVRHLLPGQNGVRLQQVCDKGGVISVGQAEGIDLIDEHAAFLRAVKQRNSQNADQQQDQRKNLSFCFHKRSPRFSSSRM